jgi:spermidine synthase
VFAISGAAGLGYQMVWTRMFAFGLGHEWPAVLAILAAFFAGLAIGSVALDRPVSRARNPGLWYGRLEIAVGVWALVSVWLIPAAAGTGAEGIGLHPSVFRHWTVAFLVPFLILLPATIALGATFPAMERFVSRTPGNERCAGGLYAINTLGALVGTLGATFVLVPAVGFGASLRFLGVLSILCGLGVIFIERRFSNCPPAPLEPSRYEGVLISPMRLRGTVFMTGLLGVGFEVLGIRILAEVFENTIYSFAAALTVFLAGTAVGAGLYQRFKRRLVGPAALSALLFALCVACLSGAWILSRAQPLYHHAVASLGDGLLPRVLAEMVVATAVFGFPTLLMGAVFAKLVQSARRSDGGIGEATAWNLAGSAAAPILFGVCLLPAIGSKWAMVLVSLGYLALLPRLSRALGIGLVLPAGLLWVLPASFHAVQAPPGGAVLELREGAMASVAVVRNFDGNRSLLVNNRFAMGGTGAASAAQRHADIPLLLHPDPKRALFLGVGTGITMGAAAVYDGLEVDGVELVPEVLEVRSHFEPFNQLRPGMRLHVADARRFIRATKTRYDVIVADLFHPARDGAGALYTVEHFKGVRERLEPGGLFCQWLPLFQLDEASLRVIVRTFLEVFPEARAFMLRWTIDTPVLGLVASLESRTYAPDWFETRVQGADLQQSLKNATLGDGFQLLGTYLKGASALAEFSAGAELNTDDRPVVIFKAPQFTYRRAETPYGRLLELLDRSAGRAEEIVKNDGSPGAKRFITELNQFFEARNRYVHGLVADSLGEKKEALEAFLESAGLSVRFSTSYAHCLSIAMRNAKNDPAGARSLLERLAQVQPQRPVAAQLIERLGDAP